MAHTVRRILHVSCTGTTAHAIAQGVECMHYGAGFSPHCAPAGTCRARRARWRMCCAPPIVPARFVTRLAQSTRLVTQLTRLTRFMTRLTRSMRRQAGNLLLKGVHKFVSGDVPGGLLQAGPPRGVHRQLPARFVWQR